MSTALERSNNPSSTVTSSGAGKSSNEYNLDRDRGIGLSGLAGQKMGCFPIYGNGTGTGNSPPELGGGGGRKLVGQQGSDSSSSTSSIGRNSDDEDSSVGRPSGGGGGGDGEEVQSKFKGGALANLEALEEVLPIKRSISQFYCGKSKSFTSLSDAASCSSMNDIVKPENAYTRKRKNFLAHNNFFDNKNRSGGISKRSTGSRSTLGLATSSLGYTESINNSDSSNSNSPSPGICLPPLPPQRRRSPDIVSSPPPEQNFSPWRSFSLSDLQGASATPSISGIMANNRHK